MERKNKDGECSCCYCLASLVVDVDALFLAVQKRKCRSRCPCLFWRILRRSPEDSQSEELLLLSDSVLEPVVPRQDYSDIFALSVQLRESQTLALQRSTLRDLARTALRQFEDWVVLSRCDGKEAIGSFLGRCIE